MKKIIGSITVESRDEIQDIFEKKFALENLFKIVDPVENKPMYDQILNDYQNQCSLYQKWWDDNNKKFGWGSGNFHVDFETQEIFILEE